MKHTLSFGGNVREISPELSESLLNAEGILFQMRRAKDQSFADVFGVLDRSLKHSPELSFIEFRPDEDISPGDVLFSPDVDELTVSKVELLFDEGEPYALRAYVTHPPAIVIHSDE